MKRLLLLDLEETIIPVWEDFYPLVDNCEIIRNYNKMFQADEVGLFSWAMWNQKDVDIWDRVKEDLEIELNVKFDHDWTIEYYIELVRTLNGPVGMDKMDFFDFYNKEQCLFVLMLAGWMDGYHIVLFDDVVKPCTVEFKNSKLEIINITELKKDGELL